MKKTLSKFALLLLIFVVCLPLIFLHFHFAMMVAHDTFAYICIARSVIQGTGFKSVWSPDMSPNYIRSPGYVLLLALVMLITGNVKAILGFKILSTICFIAFMLIISFIYNKQLRLSKIIIFGLILFIVLNISISVHASLILTEAAFLFFISLTLLLSYKFLENDSWKMLAAMIILSVITVSVRVPMIFFTFGIFIWILSLKRVKKAIVYGFSLPLLTSPWFIISWFNKGSTKVYSIRAGIVVSFFADIIKVAGDYIFIKLPLYIFPSIKALDIEFLGINPHYFKNLSIIIGFILIVVIVIGCVYALRNRASRLMLLILVAIFISYLLTTRAQMRYITALTPFIVFMFIKGFEKIFLYFKQTKKSSQKLITFILIFVNLMLIPPFFYKVGLCARERKMFYERGARIDTIIPWESDEDIDERYKALEFCKENLNKNAILISRNRAYAFFISNRKTIRDMWQLHYWDGGFKRADSLWELMLESKATHVIIDNYPPRKYYHSYHIPSINKYQNCFKTIYVSSKAPNNIVSQLDTFCLRQAILKHELNRKVNKILGTFFYEYYNFPFEYIPFEYFMMMAESYYLIFSFNN